jgi:hypothetical protein
MTNDECEWIQSSNFEYGQDYTTDCGQWFSITEGTPEQNNMKFCCYCGKKLVQVLNEPE